jgi:hypothetical protein
MKHVNKNILYDLLMITEYENLNRCPSTLDGEISFTQILIYFLKIRQLVGAQDCEKLKP